MAGYGDAPPTYEQSLQHRRVDDAIVIPPPNYAPPEYSSIHHPHDHQYQQPDQRAHQHVHQTLEQYPNAYDTFAYVRPSNPQQSRGQAMRAQVRRGRPRTTSDPVVVLDDDSSSCSSVDTGENCIRMTLVPMNMCMAVTCLIVNVLFAGMGTILSGLCVFCCVRGTTWSYERKRLVCFMNVGIGFAQLLLVPVALLGWVWSILWGFAFLGIAVSGNAGKSEDDEEDNLSTARPTLVRSLPGESEIGANANSEDESSQQPSTSSHTLEVQTIVHTPNGHINSSVTSISSSDDDAEDTARSLPDQEASRSQHHEHVLVVRHDNEEEVHNTEQPTDHADQGVEGTEQEPQQADASGSEGANENTSGAPPCDNGNQSLIEQEQHNDHISEECQLRASSGPTEETNHARELQRTASEDSGGGHYESDWDSTDNEDQIVDNDRLSLSQIVEEQDESGQVNGGFENDENETSAHEKQRKERKENDQPNRRTFARENSIVSNTASTSAMPSVTSRRSSGTLSVGFGVAAEDHLANVDM